MSSAPESHRPRAVLFDAYGTLFDVYGVSVLAEALFPGAGERLTSLWRDKQIEYTRLVSMSRDATARFRPFWDVTRAALRYATQRLSLTMSADAEDRLMAQYLRLNPFPECRSVLVGLRERGVPAGILSNGDSSMLEAVVSAAGFESLLDPLLSVQETRRYKTDPAAYAVGARALALPPEQILFVSGNCWDAIGATWYGYSTLWVNRFGLPLEQLDAVPTRTGAGLSDVIDCFDTVS